MSKSPEDRITYWITPVTSASGETAEDIIRTLVDQERIFAFSHRSSARRSLKSGDWICFYAKGKGVVAHAKAIGNPQLRSPTRAIFHYFPWVVQLDNANLYMDTPIAINTHVRSQLDAFRHKGATRQWSWFVQMTRRISQHDFNILTRR